MVFFTLMPAVDVPFLLIPHIECTKTLSPNKAQVLVKVHASQAVLRKGVMFHSTTTHLE